MARSESSSWIDVFAVAALAVLAAAPAVGEDALAGREAFSLSAIAFLFSVAMTRTAESRALGFPDWSCPELARAFAASVPARNNDAFSLFCAATRDPTTFEAMGF